MERTPMDPEISAMNTCNRALANLDELAQLRVMGWLMGKYMRYYEETVIDPPDVGAGTAGD